MEKYDNLPGQEIYIDLILLDISIGYSVAWKKIVLSIPFHKILQIDLTNAEFLSLKILLQYKVLTFFYHRMSSQGMKMRKRRKRKLRKGNARERQTATRFNEQNELRHPNSKWSVKRNFYSKISINQCDLFQTFFSILHFLLFNIVILDMSGTYSS